MNKILIYDFDGTLTPYEVPRYEILKKCNCNQQRLMEEISISMKKGLDKYEALYDAYFRILKENNYQLIDDNFILGSDEATYNKGVESFVREISPKNYLISSGIKVYLDNLTITPYFSNIYGTTFKYENGIVVGIEKIINGIEKINCIKEIEEQNPNSLIIYLGDGLTDKEAFQYVKSIGGKSLFIINNNINVYNKFKEENIIDLGFSNDFTSKGKIYTYIKNL